MVESNFAEGQAPCATRVPSRRRAESPQALRARRLAARRRYGAPVTLVAIRDEIRAHPSNRWARELGYEPIYAAAPAARIVIVGQAPGSRAQQSGVPWNDRSGETLRGWLGVDRDTFYDPNRIALLPIDFYYPGKGAHGDRPPRKDFAARWHPPILAHLHQVKLTLLVGSYAQQHYLGAAAKRNLTETVRAGSEYLPDYLPLVHPSPLNFRWQAKNHWFRETTIPALQRTIELILEN